MNNEAIQQRSDSDEVEIDLREVFQVLWQKAWLLILCLLLGGGIALGVTTQITPQYEATSTIYVFSKETDLSSLANLQIGTQLTADYEILATTRPVVEKVIQQLGLGVTYEELVKTIEVTNPNDAHMLRITVTNSDPVLAASISNALSEALSDRVEEVIDTDRPNQVEEAVIPTNASSPSMKRNILIGAMAGFVLAAAVILLRYFMDDTIQTEEDVQKHLGLNVLAAVPEERSARKRDKSDKKKKRPSATRHSAPSKPTASASGTSGGKRAGSRVQAK